MKNIIKTFLAALLPLIAMTSCEKDEILFDSQLPQFELRSDALLMEVIMPSGTSSDEDIYIAGDFNGGDEQAVGNPKWRLERAQKVDYKWGIYLKPSDFAEGKTLADGYHFVSAANGEERTFKNLEVKRTESGNIGTRINHTVERWKSYFDTPMDPSEVSHDGYVVYVDDQTGWDELYLYQWGDVNDLGGAWPGATPTGTITIGNTNYKYFDMGADNTGLNQNLIFNDNAGTQFADYAYTIDHDIYLKITLDGVSESTPGSAVSHDGFVVYVVNLTGWTDVTLYQWGEVNDLGGGWPGAAPGGTETINDIEFLYFDMGEANTGLSQNLIFSNNGNSQLSDFGYTIDHDVYLEISTSGVKEIDPATYTLSGDGEGTATPDSEPEKVAAHYLYVCDNSGWADLAVYAWADGAPELFGKWPGATSTTAKRANGKIYWAFPVYEESAAGNLIFNNNGGGEQFDGPYVTFDKDIYITITSSSYTIDEVAE